MANKILLRRGLKSKLPTLSAGEPAYTTDSREFFMGTGSGNVNMGGSQWHTGTAMSGTSTSSTYSYTSCPLVKVGDIYLNTSYGYIYQCSTAGSGTTARWQYKACIRGPQGATGATGSYFPSNGYASMDDLTSDVNDLVGNEKLAPPTSITIACRDSQHQWLANYICPDNQDHTSIFQQAINQLYIGGKITVLEGDYTIKGPLSLSGKKIIIEGMGPGTTINVSSTLINSSGNNNITFKDCSIEASNIENGIFNLVGTDNLYLDNCDFNVSIKSGTVTHNPTAIATRGNIHINRLNTNITFNDNDGECGAVFRDCKILANLLVARAKRSSGSYNINIFYNCSGRATGCKLISPQFISNDGAATGMTIDSSYVKCTSPTQTRSGSGTISNCKIVITGTTIYFGYYIVDNNIIVFTQYNTTGVYTQYCAIFANNMVYNNKSNIFSFNHYSSVKGNISRYSLTSSTPTGSDISGNIVNANMQAISSMEE